MGAYARELSVAIELVERAAPVAMAIYGREFTVEEKQNRDPVTEADRKVNTLLVEGLRAAFPDDLVIGEESGHEGAVGAHRAWFVDPIDGTSDFIRKNGEWSVMVGLVVDGVARVGVVDEPALGATYWAADGEGCFRRRGGVTERVCVRDDADPAQATVVLSRSHPDPDTEAVLAALGVTRRFQHGSVGCKVARIIDGSADLYFNFSGACHMWDVAGPDAILREAGGALVTLGGGGVPYAGATTRVELPFVACTSALRDAALERLGSWRRS